MERKISLPLAPPFMVSAPGKVILFGEHAAVYGKPTIAAAISLRSYLLVTTLSKSQRIVRLNFSDIGLNHTWEIDTLPWDTFQSRNAPSYTIVESLDLELLNAVLPHAELVSKHLPEKHRKMHTRSATAFLYLYLALGSPLSAGFIYTLRSTIPIEAGLGSSASVCVCLSAALLTQNRTLAGPHPDQTPEEAKVQLDRINRWAYVAEMCIHGDPSGVDNAVSTGGKAVIFQRSSGPSVVTPIVNFPKLRLLLIDTQQSRSTAMQVDKVKALKQRHPLMTEHILDGIGRLTTTALELISSADFKGNAVSRHDVPSALECLGDLISMNHASWSRWGFRILDWSVFASWSIMRILAGRNLRVREVVGVLLPSFGLGLKLK